MVNQQLQYVPDTVRQQIAGQNRIEQYLPKSVQDLMRGKVQDPMDQAIEARAAEEVEKEEHGADILWSALEILGRPQAMVAGLINDAIDGGDFSPLDRTWKALAGKEHYRIYDVLKSAGAEQVMSKGVMKGAGFVGDIITSPELYLNPFAGITKGAGLLKMARGKTMTDLADPKVREGLSRLVTRAKARPEFAREVGAFAMSHGIIDKDTDAAYLVKRMLSIDAEDLAQAHMPGDTTMGVVDLAAAKTVGGNPVAQLQVMTNRKAMAEITGFYYNVLRKAEMNLADPQSQKILKELGMEGFFKDKGLRAMSTADQFKDLERAVFKTTSFPVLKAVGSRIGVDLTDINVLGNVTKHMGALVANTYGKIADSFQAFRLGREVRDTWMLTSGSKLSDYYLYDIVDRMAGKQAGYRMAIDRMSDLLADVKDPTLIKQAFEYQQRRLATYGQTFIEPPNEVAVSIANSIDDIMADAGGELALSNILPFEYQNLHTGTLDRLEAFDNMRLSLLHQKTKEGLATIGKKEEFLARKDVQWYAERQTINEEYWKFTADEKRFINSKLEEKFGSPGLGYEISKWKTKDIEKEFNQLVRDRIFEKGGHEARKQYWENFEAKEKFLFTSKWVDGPRKSANKYGKIQKKHHENIPLTPSEQSYKAQFERQSAEQNLEAAILFENDVLKQVKFASPRIMPRNTEEALLGTLNTIKVRGKTLPQHAGAWKKERVYKFDTIEELQTAFQTGTLSHRQFNWYREALQRRMRGNTKEAKRLRKAINEAGPLDFFLGGENLIESMDTYTKSIVPAVATKNYIDTMVNLFGIPLRTMDDKVPMGFQAFSFTENGYKHGIGLRHWDNLSPGQQQYIRHQDKNMLVGKEDVADMREITHVIGRDKTKLIEAHGAGIDRYAIPTEIGESFNRVSEWFQNPQIQNKFYQMAQKITGFWKAHTLLTIPAFHSRNMFGDLYLNFMAGLWNPKYYIKAAAMQFKYGRNLHHHLKKPISMAEDQITRGNVKMSDLEVLDGFARHGLTPTYRHAELGVPNHADLKTITAPKHKKIIKSLDPTAQDTFVGFLAGRKVGDFINTTSRLAHYMWQLEKGANPYQAAMSVKKHLYDYNQLTQMERNWFRLVVPFYTWLRRNLPHQVVTFFEKPGLFSSLNRLTEALYDSNSDVNRVAKDQLPGWIRRNYALISRNNPYTGELDVQVMANWIPAADLNYLAHMPTLLKQSLHPGIKAAVELDTGESMFTGKPISEVEGQKVKVFGMMVNKELVHHLRSVARPISEIEKVYQTFHPEESLREQIKPREAIQRLIAGTPRRYKFNLEKLKKRKMFDIKVRSAALRRHLQRARKLGDPDMIRHTTKMLQDAQTRRLEEFESI